MAEDNTFFNDFVRSLPDELSPDTEYVPAVKENGTEVRIRVDRLPGGGGGGGVPGVSDHGALTGLADDDHPHYHTDARGDARYYTQSAADAAFAPAAHVADTGNPHAVTAAQAGAYTTSEVDAALASKADTGHDHAGVYAPAAHGHPRADRDYDRTLQDQLRFSLVEIEVGAAFAATVDLLAGGVHRTGALLKLTSDVSGKVPLPSNHPALAEGEATALLYVVLQTSAGDYALTDPDPWSEFTVVGAAPTLAAYGATLVTILAYRQAGGDVVFYVGAGVSGGGGAGGGAPAGPNGAVLYNSAGVMGGESPLVYDEVNNTLSADLYARSVVYPYATGVIGGGSAPCEFEYNQILRLTITSNLTVPLAAPVEVKQISTSAFGLSTQYFALVQLIIKQDETGNRTFPTTFWDNYVLSGRPPALPTAPNSWQEYLLVGEWNGTAWVSWRVLGEPNAFSPRRVTSTPVALAVTDNQVLCLSGAGTLNLPTATGKGIMIVVVNRSGGTVTLVPAGSDTIAGGATTISNGDTVALIDSPVGADEWMRL